MSAFFDAVGDFFGSLASIHWGALLLGLETFIAYLTVRARAYFHVLRAAYPDERIAFRRIWGAYMAAYGAFWALAAAATRDLARERGWTRFAAAGGTACRYAVGVTPYVRLKLEVNEPTLCRPTETQMSATERSVVRSSAAARSMRRVSRY